MLEVMTMAMLLFGDPPSNVIKVKDDRETYICCEPKTLFCDLSSRQKRELRELNLRPIDRSCPKQKCKPCTEREWKRQNR